MYCVLRDKNREAVQEMRGEEIQDRSDHRGSPGFLAHYPNPGGQGKAHALVTLIPFGPFLTLAGDAQERRCPFLITERGSQGG